MIEQLKKPQGPLNPSLQCRLQMARESGLQMTNWALIWITMKVGSSGTT